MNKECPLVSVYTCVYNGEKTLHRVFNSMKALTYPNIEHVIINDGSIDATDTLIKEYIKEVDFPVKYVKKENGGKHTALNIAWDIAEGFFMISLDADDELFPHAISYLVNKYFEIPENIRDDYWCVHGRCVTQNGDFVGVKYPDDINNRSWQEASEIAKKCSGEKIGLQRRDYLVAYRFPPVKGVSFLPEIIIWSQINQKYGTWYTNEVVRTYYVGEGGNLSQKASLRKHFGPFAYHFKWRIINEKFYGSVYKNLFKYSLCYFISGKEYRKNNKYFQDITRHKFLLGLISPFTCVGAVLYRLLKRIK